MKQSLNPASVKGISASPLRALSGDLKCTTAGNITLGYAFNIVYTTVNGVGVITFVFTTPNNNQAPLGRPYANWVCRQTVNITTPMPSSGFAGTPVDTTMKFSISEHAVAAEGYGGSVAMDPAIASNAWSNVTLFNSSGQQFKNVEIVGRKWNTVFVSSINVQGPDLRSVGDIDLSRTYTEFATFTILPPQTEFCSIQFYPFFFQATDAQGKPAPEWTSVANGFGIIGNFGSKQQWAPNLFPNGTILGNIRFELFRVTTTPLFTWSITPPRTVSFVNSSFFNANLAPTWDWDFGDGTAHSNLQNPPAHTYAAVGTYNVKLTASDATGKVTTFDQFVTFPLKADFTFHLDGIVSATLFQVTFTNQSIGAATYDWDFGDGSAHSNAVSPVHQYLRHSTFNCKLTASDGFGNSQSITKTIVIP